MVNPESGSLRSYLQGVHWGAGKPSMRTIARAIGMSHTTVALVLNGRYATAWPTVEKVANYLGADPEETRAAWVAQRAEDTQQSSPAAGGRSELAGLLGETNSLLRSILERLDAIAPPLRTSGGVELTDEVLDAAAEEAERGYDPSQIRPRSGRTKK